LACEGLVAGLLFLYHNFSNTHASSPLFSLPDSRGRLGRGNGPRCSLIMNHRRHLPLFIVVRARLIYRHDSRAYYSRFLPRRLRIYYSAAGFRFGPLSACARLIRRPMKSALLHCVESAALRPRSRPINESATLGPRMRRKMAHLAR
jgi:hypothetical protein